MEEILPLRIELGDLLIEAGFEVLDWDVRSWEVAVNGYPIAYTCSPCGHVEVPRIEQ